VAFNYGATGFTFPGAGGALGFGAVRLVRGNAYAGSTRFTFEPISYGVDAANNIAVDSLTGLKWRRCSEGQNWNGTNCVGEATSFDLFSALAHAKLKDGWRLPDIRELSSIHDKSERAPAINPVVFPDVFVGANVRLSSYWSSSPSPFSGTSGDHWYVQFSNERQVVGTNWQLMDALWKLRLVR